MTEPVRGEERELLRDMSERASTLYWNSDRSVNSIADDLGLSKGRLYDLIRPLGSGQLCPKCNSELIFENRTARERDDGICPICDSDGLPVESTRSAAQRYSDLSVAAATGADTSAPPLDSNDPASEVGSGSFPLPAETRGVVAGFLIGTVAGILLGRHFTR